MALEQTTEQQRESEIGSDISSNRYEGPEIALGRAGRALISSDRPLPEYDSPHAKAYHAVSRVDNTRTVIALVCEPNLPPRFDAMSRLRGFHLPGLLKVQDWGLVSWNQQGERRFVVILDRPSGTRVFPNLQLSMKPLSEDIIVTGFLQQVMPVLREMQQRNVTHRGDSSEQSVLCRFLRQDDCPRRGR